MECGNDELPLRVDQDHAPHARKFDVFGDRACVGIFGDEGNRSSKLIAKEIRSLGAIASPPTRFIPDLPSSGRGGLYAKRHRSVRLVQLCEEIVDVNELAAIGLSDGFQKHALLFSGDAESFSVVA